MKKRCAKCRVIKDISAFYKGKERRWHDSYCKLCRSLYEEEKYAKNRDKILSQHGLRYKNNPEVFKERSQRRLASNPHRVWASHTIYAHRRKGLIVNITPIQLELIAKATPNCSICGVALLWGYYNKDGIHQGRSPSLDRVLNGDTLDLTSIQIVCYQCNAAKLKMNMKEFISYCQRIVDRAKKGEIKYA